MKETIGTKIHPDLAYLNYGGAMKFITEMNSDELKLVRESILHRAREKAFSKGLPIYYIHEKRLIGEYPDGTIQGVES